MFDLGRIRMTTSQLHTVKPLDVDIPRGRLVAVTGVSGSGKTTMVLESLIPALKAQAAGERLPEHVRELEAEGIHRANLIDATPIGANVRSPWPPMPIFTTNCAAPSPARTAPRRAAGRLAISHTTPADCVAHMRRTGSISLDVQFLPDVTIECPDCGGSRYASEADAIRRAVKAAKAKRRR